MFEKTFFLIRLPSSASPKHRHWRWVLCEEGEKADRGKRNKRMSGRKHLIQQVLRGDVQPPSEGQSIVRAVGSRGGNIMEVRGT